MHVAAFFPSLAAVLFSPEALSAKSQRRHLSFGKNSENISILVAPLPPVARNGVKNIQKHLPKIKRYIEAFLSVWIEDKRKHNTLSVCIMDLEMVTLREKRLLFLFA